MIGFLKLVGAILLAVLLALIILAVAGYFWLRWKFKELSDSISDKMSDAFEGLAALGAGSVPPLRIKLMRLEGQEWSDENQMDTWTQGLIEAGFEVIGDFEVEPAMMELRALCHTDTRTYAVVYEHPMVGQWFDLTSRTVDNQGSFTLSNNQGNQMDSRDEHPTVRVTALTTPAKAYEKFLRDRPEQDWAPATPADFVPRFEQGYANEMDWRLQRGGPTEEEVRRIAQQDGTEATPEMVRAIQNAWKMQAECLYEDELMENYLDQCDLSAQAWEEIRDRLILIHQFTSLEQISDYIFELADLGPEDDWDSEKADEIEVAIQQLFDTQSPEDAFDTLIQKHQLARYFQKHGTVTDPIPATIYVGPEYDDDGELVVN